MKRGFFVFEGVEGSGKSTLIQSLADNLSHQNHSVSKTREPGGTEFGSKIRQILLQNIGTKVNSTAELLLFYADRAQHIQEIIKPRLENNEIVLCDRYFYSTIAYQCSGRGLDRNLINALNDIVLQDFTPQGVILLDIDPTISFERVKKRGELDAFEKEHLDFHKRIRAGYLELSKEFPEIFLTLDARKKPEELLHEALDFITKKLGG